METTWFCLLAFMLVMYVVLDGFDLGAGIIHLFVARNDAERRMVLNAIGPVWDGNEVWLLAAGGTLYFAFPAVYAAAFSGFYLPLIIILWLLMLRGLGIEFRHQLADVGVAALITACGGKHRSVVMAQELGASRWRAFREVTLPLLGPPIAAAATIVFLFTFTAFGVVLLLADPAHATIEVEIYRRAVQLFDLPIAAALALVQMAAVVALLLLVLGGRAVIAVFVS